MAVKGAGFFSEALPQALSFLPAETLNCLNIVQQARPEDLETLTARYDDLNVQAKIAPFFNNMAEEIKRPIL